VPIRAWKFNRFAGGFMADPALKNYGQSALVLRRVAPWAGLLLLAAFVWYAKTYFNEYPIRILNNIAIFIILAVSYNLINGITGQFSLAPNAFLAIGAYTSALLTLTPDEKAMSFLIEPLVWPLSEITVSFPLSLAAGGLMAALCALLVAAPVFRTRGDYLAIVTLGFGEVVQVLANNLVSVTNGPLGLKGLTPYTDLWWTWGACVFTVFCVHRLTHSSYGRAMMAVREDETAAEAMAVNAFRTKTLAFTVSAFFQGAAGGLLAHLITTISPVQFGFMFTFHLLAMIVIGGLGSTWGAVIGAALLTWASEFLRFIEEPIRIFGYSYQGVPGMRMLIFSGLLIVVMIFAPGGVMGLLRYVQSRIQRLRGRSARGEA
jgi:branched-chain amino acid transport system permease protein